MYRTAISTLACVIPLFGCSGGSDDGPETFSMEGQITAEDGQQADVAIRKAFGFATNGSGLVYFASNEEATCANVLELLETDEAHNPDRVLLAGHCNLVYKFKFEGEPTFDDLTFTEEDTFSSIWSVSCGMGEGAWEYANNDGDKDYFYTGSWWQGSPIVYSSTVSGTGDNMRITATLGPYAGHYIYEGLDEVSGTGLVSGDVEIQRCTGLAQTALFPF